MSGIDPSPFFVHRHPDATMRGLVDGFFAYEERGVALQNAVETASLTVPLIINFGGPYRIGLGRRPSQADHIGSFASGLFAGPVLIDSDGCSQCIQVNFTPLGGRLFFGLPMSQLADLMVRLDELGDPGILQLADRLAALNSWEARLDLAGRFVGDRLARASRAEPAVSWAFHEMLARSGAVRTGAIARKLDWSRRKLVERFRTEIGLPPKAVARIIRFNAAQTAARASASPNWADIAAQYGFADQAHLSREFAELAGASPTAWRRAA